MFFGYFCIVTKIYVTIGESFDAIGNEYYERYTTYGT